MLIQWKSPPENKENTINNIINVKNHSENQFMAIEKHLQRRKVTYTKQNGKKGRNKIPSFPH